MAKKDSKKNKIIHLVRYGTSSDQKYLLGDFLKTYDITVLNANIVVHTPAAISTFLFEHSLNKPFIIDPQTFAFELDLKHIRSKSKGKSKGKIKKPFVKLAGEYGELFSERLNSGKPILPENVKKQKKTIVTKVCDFQLNYIKNQTEDDDVEKYYDFVEEEEGLKFNGKPEFLIPPYFYIDGSKFDSWLEVNIDLVNETIDQYSDNKITPQLVISKDILLNTERIDEIVAAYSKIENIHSILVWIDNHHETKLNANEIEAFISFFKKLGNSHKLINLYGGGLSIILARSQILENLHGVCHSIEYGEARAVAPVGGGIPVSKFYIPSTHFRFLYRNAITILKNNNWLKSPDIYFKNVCGCKTCRSIIKLEPDIEFESFGKMFVKKSSTPDGQEISKQYPTGESKDLCKRHYMFTKFAEYNESKFENLSAMVKSLRTIAEDMPEQFSEETKYLKEWAAVLEDEAKKE